jgi:hypothetical protein
MRQFLPGRPRCHDSGGKSRAGHITRESRKLSRTILTQSIYQTIKGTLRWERDYEYRKALEEGKKSEMLLGTKT